MSTKSLIIAAAFLMALTSAFPTNSGDATGCPFHKPSTSDMTRAHTTKHTSRMGGRSPLEIASKINAQMEQTGTTMDECESFDHDELNQMVRDMWCHLSEDIHAVYKSRNNGTTVVGGKPLHIRADKRELRFKSLEEYDNSWLLEKEHMHSDQTAKQALQEAKCAEILMMWAHHVPEEAKKSLMSHKVSKLPKIPTFKPELASHNNTAVANLYSSSFTCVSGHDQESTSPTVSDHVYPHWPKEVHYTGMGHGAYPFWLGGGGSGGSGAPIEVWWSEIKGAEKFYHSSCSMTEAGYSSDAACYHLFVGTQPSPKAYLYTATEDFCCESTGVGEKLSAPQSNWMDKMTVNENYGNVTSTFLGNVQVKQYLMTLPTSEPVTYFWYLTTMDDLPVQQGEGGFGGKGIEIYHEYNTTSFESVSLDSSVFDIPSICKTSTKKCRFP